MATGSVTFWVGGFEFTLGDVLVAVASGVSLRRGDYEAAGMLLVSQGLHRILVSTPETPYRSLALNFVSLAGMSASEKFVNDSYMTFCTWSHLFAWQIHNYRNSAVTSMIMYDTFGRYVANSPGLQNDLTGLVGNIYEYLHGMKNQKADEQWERVMTQRAAKLDELAPLISPARPRPEGGLAPFNTECSMCLVEIEATQPQRVLRCGHAFHQGCIDDWLVRYTNSLCPFCKQPLVESLGGANGGGIVDHIDRHVADQIVDGDVGENNQEIEGARNEVAIEFGANRAYRE